MVPLTPEVMFNILSGTSILLPSSIVMQMPLSMKAVFKRSKGEASG